ncbi:hypothetical protein H257_11079 [Aphanomyces astaci]|uniref:Uncharacterized protein n=1 Tax=Aphanomyces astaci TaxID=112090 RepID=W4G520_APHAT|nr:hypothetical protein H257_11079 [Aphanomyces astaci]ETV74114.1 hypothetical protein H257_11079 [Aphanomyces astaci]|eukprot:XP_009836220.1 hypothetical protein H257_11079 [Aphanomyces astaci]
MRLEECAGLAGCSNVDLLAWSSHLSTPIRVAAVPLGSTRELSNDSPPSDETAEQRLIRHQASVIDHFIDIGRRQEERLQALEEKLQTRAIPKRKETEVKVGQVMPNSKLKRQKQFHASKQKKYTSKHIVAYMKLFLPDGFVLDEDSQTFRDDMLSTEAAAEIAALEFLLSNNVQSKGTSAVLKALQGTHRLGHLNARIIHYCQLRASRVIDPPPPVSLNILDESN